MKFSEIILQWYSENKRSLPWRSTNDPYNIWLSEIILQQTRVAQGTPYYLRFIKNFPGIKDLAEASEEEILKNWQGLGYYSRARNLHATAKVISDEYDGKFPQSYEELLVLPGIGDYTASAIASICFNLPEAVVDGNVYRVLARYYGVDIPINSTKGKNYFRSLAQELIDPDHIREYNQAIMEFGAVQCKPANPNCVECPLSSACVAYATHKVSELPVKNKKIKIRNRYFNYLVGIDGDNHTQLVQRKHNDIWKSLYEFPLLETASEVNVDQVYKHCNQLLMVNDVEDIYETDYGALVHKLSHQRLHTRFWIVKTNDQFPEGIPVEKLDQYPVPVPIAKFINTFKNSYF